MGHCVKPVMVLVGALALTSLSGTVARADEPDLFPSPVPGNRSVNAEFEDAFFSNDRDFFRNRTLPRQVSFLFGPGILIRNSFPENEIARDARNLLEVYRTVSARQVPLPVIRTVDLPSPFSLSVRNLPSAEPAPLPVQPSVLPPIPERSLPGQRQPGPTPVPALW